MIYTGPAGCPACGIPGSEKSRHRKDEICSDCRELINIGRELKPDYRPKHYIHVDLQWYTLQYYGHGRRTPEIEEAFKELLEAMHRKRIGYAETIRIYDDNRASSDQYIVRKEYAVAIKKLTDILRNQQNSYTERMAEIEIEMEKEIKKVKNKIFNAGVAKGKQLLIGLNQGTISLTDFDAIIEKF